MQKKSDSNFQEQVDLRSLVSFSRYIARPAKGFNGLLTNSRGENRTHGYNKVEVFLKMVHPVFG